MLISRFYCIIKCHSFHVKLLSGSNLIYILLLVILCWTCTQSYVYKISSFWISIMENSGHCCLHNNVSPLFSDLFFNYSLHLLRDIFLHLIPSIFSWVMRCSRLNPLRCMMCLLQTIPAFWSHCSLHHSLQIINNKSKKKLKINVLTVILK